MKQTVTDINDLSEPAIFFNSAIEHYNFDSFFENFPVDSSPVERVDNLSEINNCIVVPFTGETFHNVYNVHMHFRLDLSSWTLFLWV